MRFWYGYALLYFEIVLEKASLKDVDSEQEVQGRVKSWSRSNPMHTSNRSLNPPLVGVSDHGGMKACPTMSAGQFSLQLNPLPQTASPAAAGATKSAAARAARVKSMQDRVNSGTPPPELPAEDEAIDAAKQNAGLSRVKSKLVDSLKSLWRSPSAKANPEDRSEQTNDASRGRGMSVGTMLSEDQETGAVTVVDEIGLGQSIGRSSPMRTSKFL